MEVFQLAVDTPQDEHHLTTHYTNYDTGLKILGSKTLWATDHQYLNDSQEVQYGVEKILRLLDINEQEIPNIDVIKKILKYKLANNHYNMLITSLIKHDDSLPCWRYFGGDGTRISIFFNKAHLTKGFKQRGISSLMSDVVYSDYDQKQLIEQL